MTCVDVLFPVTGRMIPADHRYALYRAVRACVGPALQQIEGVGIAAICGEPGGRGVLLLTPRSVLRIRTPQEHAALWDCLRGRLLRIDGHSVQLGAPSTEPLRPAPVLGCPLVTIKGCDRIDAFLRAARRQLDRLGIGGRIVIPPRRAGAHAGRPARRVLRVAQRLIVGYALRVEELGPEESLRLQVHGIGGRRRMGCGIFVPAQVGRGTGPRGV